MKKTLYSLALIVMLPLAGCHQPEELVPPVANKGINAFTAYPTWEGYHTADESGFPGEIDYEEHTITVQVPYTYPVESDNVQSLENYTKVYVMFNLDDNVTVEPSLHTIDLTQRYTVTVTDQQKQKTEWTIKAALKKSDACDIESFTVRDIDVSAIIDKNSATASLIYFEELKNVFADYTLSPHAKIVPDPATKAFWCSPDQPMTFTVIAQDGVTSREWTLQQSEPTRVESGMRQGSGKLLWATKLSAVGVNTLDITTSVAATDDHVVINPHGEAPIILDAKSGAVVGKLDLGQYLSPTKSYFITSDDAGHLIISNLIPDDGGVFRILRMKDVYSTPEVFIEHATTEPYGKHVSVRGDVYGDAVISAVYCGWTSTGTTSTWRWFVKGGAPVSQTPVWAQVTGMSKGWTNGDAAYGGTDETSDYFVCGYSSNTLTWVDGATNTAKASMVGELTGNEQMLAVDAREFNGVNYVITAMETSFTWGVAGAMWIVEAKYPETFTGRLDDEASPVVYSLDRGSDGYGKYGGRLNDGQNSNAFVDVVLHTSSDGYFMNAYFMFCNGYVGCVQFDCIAQE